ncbi:MAG: tRNA (guanosine(37)-N1)-methyltransferase TrmD [Alphaproteobacteria bacterium]|nr:tRNA (guanosine(37)-N1)-methyltransferase TrmD [Alphaproteobacteria bacterium]
MTANALDRAEPLWTTQVLTLLPEAFPGPLGLSLAGRALKTGIWNLETVDIRRSATDRHHTVDDTPFGGGPGMVLRPDVLARAIETALQRGPAIGPQRRLVYLSPRGRLLDQTMVRELAAADWVTLICGRFEGVDQRLIEARAIEEISLGDFVLSGGEPAAIALIDAIVRLLPGVIGDADGLNEESFADDLLEYPHYTKPRVWEDRPVPDVLLSGHHDAIRRWRQAQSEEITKQRRPDLWRRHLARNKTGVEP